MILDALIIALVNLGTGMLFIVTNLFGKEKATIAGAFGIGLSTSMFED